MLRLSFSILLALTTKWNFLKDFSKETFSYGEEDTRFPLTFVYLAFLQWEALAREAQWCLGKSLCFIIQVCPQQRLTSQLIPWVSEDRKGCCCPDIPTLVSKPKLWPTWLLCGLNWFVVIPTPFSLLQLWPHLLQKSCNYGFCLHSHIDHTSNWFNSVVCNYFPGINPTIGI